MRRTALGFACGVASSVIVVWAQIITWGLMAQHYEDEEERR